MPWAVIIHTTVIYLGLILGLRYLGRRQLGQLTPVDLVIIVLLGSAVETSMVAGDTSLIAGIASAATLLLWDRAAAFFVSRSRFLRRVLQGVPVLIILNGRFLEDHLRLVGLTQADVLEALRARGEAGPENVKFAILEVDGEINVVPKERPTLGGKRSIRFQA